MTIVLLKGLFREFVLSNSEHELAGSAQYWYAETFRIRQLYTDAASAYLEGYQKYPKGTKAPINLLKLGVSMVQIGEKDQGCKMINGVELQYPKANQSVIQKAKYESKNLNVSKKTHSFLLSKLRDKRTLQIYKKFEGELNINKNFIVAASGGPDSLALSFLAKIYSIKNSINVKYFIVDHRLRKNSTSEAKDVQKRLKNFSIELKILSWRGLKPRKNIQSIARDKRYKLLTDIAKKIKLKIFY